MRHLTKLAQYVKRRYLPLDHDPTDDPSESYYADLYLAVLRRHLASLSTSATILDVGCGTGRIAVPLAADGHRFTGIDHHRATIEILRRNCGEAGVEMTIVDRDLTDYLSEEATTPFDAALAIESLYVVPDLATTVARIVSRVRSGGLVCITHRPRYYYVWSSLAAREFDDARLVASASEGWLTKGHHRAYYNWQTKDEIESMYAAAGADILEMHAIGPFSGILSDPAARLCDPATLTKEERSQLGHIETTIGGETLMASRYVLVVAKVR